MSRRGGTPAGHERSRCATNGIRRALSVLAALRPQSAKGAIVRVRRAGEWYHGGEASAFLLADGRPFEPRGGPFVVRGSGTLRGRCTMSIQHVEHMKASLARRACSARRACPGRGGLDRAGG